MLFLCVASPAQTSDTDGDGQTDSQELLAGTDPYDDQSVEWTGLAAWRFDDGSFVGNAGQEPISTENVVITAGFEDFAASFAATDPIVKLQYRGIEEDGSANISLKRGSIRFRLRTFWMSNDPSLDITNGGHNFIFSGVGPGEWVTLVQTTNLALRIDPDGTNLVLTSLAADGTIVTNLQTRITVEAEDPRPSRTLPGVSYWYDVMLSYSPEQTAIFWGAPGNRASGTGIAPLENIAQRNQAISFGSALDGTGKLNGILDEITTYNAPGILHTNPWRISVVAESSPPAVRLAVVCPTNLVMDVKKRQLGSHEWRSAPGAFGTNYVDRNVQLGLRYEYLVNTGFSETNGYRDNIGHTITASVHGSPIEQPGAVILLVDQTLASQLEPELSTYITNLVGDGWQVLRKDVPRHIDDYTSSTSFLTNHFNITSTIKPFVVSNYHQFGTNIRQILIVGHVAIPYTGRQADDGHSSPSAPYGSHSGAWASDMFYGDIDGVWTDVLNVQGSLFPENHNYPGDGKWDQDYLPRTATTLGSLEIPAARIDFARMPAFAESETTLLKRYLTKNVRFRNGILNFAPRAIGADLFFDFRTITAPVEMAHQMASKLQVGGAGEQADFFLETNSFLFGAQSGSGYVDRINDARPQEQNTGDFAAGRTAPNGAFYFFRSSFFQDWNLQNNFMRAVLAPTNGGLAAGWFISMGPWRTDPLGAGLTLGHATREQVSTRLTNFWGGQSGRATQLLGDSTLRYPVLPPPGVPSGNFTPEGFRISWSPPVGIAPQYAVYRSTNGVLGSFERLNELPISATNFFDTNPPSGTLLYMVRALHPSVTGGGTFTNLSQGVFLEALVQGQWLGGRTTLEDQVSDPIQISIGDAALEPGLTIRLTSSNSELVPIENISMEGSGAERTFVITPRPDEFGTSEITITTVTDLSTNSQFFHFTILPVNDPPSFTRGVDYSIAQNSGSQTVHNWAQSIRAGPVNEAGQGLAFEVVNNAPHLFAEAPAISPEGTLTYTPSSFRRGLAMVSVQLRDDGGTVNGGNDSSPVETFFISVGLPLDDDGDGLPNDYEELSGLNPFDPSDTGVDWDGDGFTALEEFTMRTDPRNARSTLGICGFGLADEEATIEFESEIERPYSIQFSDTLPDSWPELTSGIAGTGQTISVTDPAATGAIARHYRVTTTGPSGTLLASEAAGFRRFTLLGNSDTLISAPFLRLPAETCAVEDVAGSSVRVRGTPPWATNQWVYSSLIQTNTYFALVRSGALEGRRFTIIGNTSDTLALDAEESALEPLEAGDRILVVPYWTVGTMFEGGAGIHDSPSIAVRATELLLPDIGAAGTNHSSGRVFYFWEGAWREAGKGLSVKNDEVILPDMYLWVRHNIPVDTHWTSKGMILPSNLTIPIVRNVGAGQDNYLALPRPNAISFRDSGLFESGAVRTSINQPLDLIFLFNNTVSLRNKSSSAAYYYMSGAWRKIGMGRADVGSDLLFSPGGGWILRSGPGEATVWENSGGY